MFLFVWDLPSPFNRHNNDLPFLEEFILIFFHVFFHSRFPSKFSCPFESEVRFQLHSFVPFIDFVCFFFRLVVAFVVLKQEKPFWLQFMVTRFNLVSVRTPWRNWLIIWLNKDTKQHLKHSPSSIITTNPTTKRTEHFVSSLLNTSLTNNKMIVCLCLLLLLLLCFH